MTNDLDPVALMAANRAIEPYLHDHLTAEARRTAAAYTIRAYLAERARQGFVEVPRELFNCLQNALSNIRNGRGGPISIATDALAMIAAHEAERTEDF
jgi:hypothetical protein